MRGIVMKILITGGSGVIGSVLLRELRNRGYIVYFTDIDNHYEDGRFYVRADISNYRQIARVFEQAGPFELVYHLAAEFGRWCGEDFYEQIWMANAIGTKNVLRLQEKYGFRMVFASSSEVYGDYPGTFEEDLPSEKAMDLLNDYALSKWVGEQQIRNSARMFGTESVIVRLSGIYGPGEWYSKYRNVYTLLAYRALAREKIVIYRGHTRSALFIADAVRTLANIADRFNPGKVYNIASDYVHTMEELGELIREFTGAPEELIEYRDSEPFTTKKKVLSVERAKKELDHKWEVNVREGMHALIEWMKAVYPHLGYESNLRGIDLLDPVNMRMLAKGDLS